MYDSSQCCVVSAAQTAVAHSVSPPCFSCTQADLDEVAVAQCARFLPFSAETTGGLGKDAEELIDQISLACRDHLALPSHYHVANSVRASVAIAVQKGNALAIFGGYSRVVMHAGQPHAAA